MNVLTYGEWRDTCDTVHMLLQMMGKAKLQSMDPQPEWKQVVLDADANGFTTGLIPFGADGFEIKLNIADAEMAAMTAAIHSTTIQPVCFFRFCMVHLPFLHGAVF